MWSAFAAAVVFIFGGFYGHNYIISQKNKKESKQIHMAYILFNLQEFLSELS